MPEVVAIEPARTLRRSAVHLALRAGIPVDVVPGIAEALPVRGEAFDGVAGGCHTSRDELGAIKAAGFTVETYRRVTLPEHGVRLPTAPCVLGVAGR